MFSLFKQSLKTEDIAEVCWKSILKNRQWYIDEVIGNSGDRIKRLVNEPDEFVYYLFFIDDWSFNSQIKNEDILKSFRNHFYRYIWKYADENKCNSIVWGKWLIEHCCWQPPDSSYDNKTPKENLNKRLELYNEAIQRRVKEKEPHGYVCSRLCLALSGNIDFADRLDLMVYFLERWKFHKEVIKKFKIK